MISMEEIINLDQEYHMRTQVENSKAPFLLTHSLRPCCWGQGGKNTPLNPPIGFLLSGNTPDNFNALINH